MRLQALLFPKTDDAPGHPDVQADGQAVLFKKEDLDAFLTGVRISSQEEIAEEANRYIAGRK